MERHERAKQLYHAALLKDAGERAAFLEEACAGDEALRREVLSLLGYPEDAETSMGPPATVASGKSSEAPDPLVGRTLSRYRVQSLLGAGGMGKVYLAQDTRLERTVALKILPPDFAFDADRMQRFIGEAKAASALNHPNVATIYDLGVSDGVQFIAMEYVEGRTLAAMIAGGPLTAPDIVDIGAQVADALDAAHAKGITHRDIKPTNLMMTRRGQMKVLDFGIAKTTRGEGVVSIGARSTGTDTEIGVRIGSVPHMSPEQVLGHEVDHRSDLFSLGVVLYEMAAGRLPFVGTTTSDTLDLILNEPPPPIARFNAHIPSELERITLKCLEKDVERRYQSADELLVDLRNLKRQADVDVTRSTIGETPRHNLPAPLTSFVGRGQEINEVRRLFAVTRLMTLTGTGGCGKTRLALQVAGQLLDQFHDGVWVVDLAPLSKADLITQTMAAVLGVREGPGRSLQDALADYFRPRHTLLVLDNCEHLIAACAQLVEPLLLAAPNLHILGTSREALGIPGETVWSVPSLSLPRPSEPVPAGMLLQFEAVRLFADRAAAVEPTFTINESNAAVVSEVCCRLDGIPLAIELAAARLKVLSIDQINMRLNNRFRLLTGGSRTAVARQRTLEATIDWSYELLSETERELLRRLSIFPGDWTLEAAEQVCSGGAIDKDDMLDLLTRLVDKSLVMVEPQPTGERRHRFLETVRQYGRERLLQAGEIEKWRDRHLAFFFESFRHTEPQLRGPEQLFWLNRLQIEHDNLRSALEWCLEVPGHARTGLELATALFWFWLRRGYLSEGQHWLERMLAVNRDSPPGVRAQALIGLSQLTYFQGNYAQTRLVLEQSLALAREVDDLGIVAFSLFMQAEVAFNADGDVATAVRLATESHAAAIASGELWLQGAALACLAYEPMIKGDFDRACQLIEDGLKLMRRIGNRFAMSFELGKLAFCRIQAGHYAQAEAYCAEGIVLGHEFTDRFITGMFMLILSAAHAAQGHALRSARLWGAGEKQQESVVGQGISPRPKIVLRDRYLTSVKTSLGEEAFYAAQAEGRAMSFNQAVQYTLAETS